MNIFSGLDTGGSARQFGGTGLGELTIGGVFSGAGAVTFARGNYTMTNGANSFSGGVTVSGGRLTLTGPGNLNLGTAIGTSSLIGQGPITINGGEVRLLPVGTNVVGNITRPVTFGLNGGALTYAGNPGNGVALNLVMNNGTTPAVIRNGTANLNYNGGSPSLNLNGLSGGGIATFELTNGAYLRMNSTPVNGVATYTGGLLIRGQPNGDTRANGADQTVGRFAFINGTSNIITGGLVFENVVQFSIEASGQNAAGDFPGGRLVDANITINNGTTVFSGRGTGTAGTNAHTLSLGTFGNITARTLTIKDTATAQMDIQVRTDQPNAGFVNVNMPTVIEAGGTLRYTRSQFTNNTPATVVAIRRINQQNTIEGRGGSAKDSIIDLELGAPQGAELTNGVSFAANANLIVNGSGLGGLRVQGTGAFVDNLLTPARIQTLTGSGGTLTVAYSDNSSRTFNTSPTVGTSVKLGLDKQGSSAPTYTLGAVANDLANWGGIVVKGGTVNVGANQSFVGNGVTPTTLTVTGGSLLVNGGNLTFSGAAAISGGSLTIASGRTLSATQVTVTSGATIGGAGTIAAPMTVGAGGILSPGSSAGTITVASLTLDPASILNFELSTAGVVSGGINDLVAVNGNLGLDGTLNVTRFGNFGAGTYTLINFTGALTDGGLALGSMPAGFSYLIQPGAGKVDLVVSAVPEPGTLGLLGLGFGMGITLLSRRARRA
jgi:fibronectin-binding autotransporter adhesin